MTKTKNSISLKSLLLVTLSFVMRKSLLTDGGVTDDSGSRMNGNKRVFLVTDNDEPPGSSSTRQAARTTFGVGCPPLAEKAVS